MSTTAELGMPIRDDQYRAMSLHEVDGLIEAYTDRFEQVRRFYTDRIGSKRRRILEFEVRKINSVMDHLVPMLLSEEVKAEYAACDTPEAQAASANGQIGSLAAEMGDFLARFENTDTQEFVTPHPSTAPQ